MYVYLLKQHTQLFHKKGKKKQFSTLILKSLIRKKMFIIQVNNGDLTQQVMLKKLNMHAEYFKMTID